MAFFDNYLCVKHVFFHKKTIRKHSQMYSSIHIKILHSIYNIDIILINCMSVYIQGAKVGGGGRNPPEFAVDKLGGG